MTLLVKPLELRKLSKERIKEARILLAADKLDGAKYLGGYAVEHALKYRICKKLGWSSYPPPNPKAGTAQSSSWSVTERGIKTHDLEILLLFSGEFEAIFADASLAAAWDNVKGWASEMRYERTAIKQTEKAAIKDMLDSVSVIMRHLGCPVS